MKTLYFILALLFTVSSIFAQHERRTGSAEWKVRNGTGKVEVLPGTVSTLEFNDLTSIKTDGVYFKFYVGSSEKFAINANQTFVQSISGAKAGATAGWVVNAGTNVCLATLPASQSGSTLIIPIRTPLKIGSTITGFSVIGQIESAGGTVTLTAELRKHTAAAADVADATVGSLASNVSVTADAALSATNAVKTGLTEVVAADETFYILITATTAGSTDIALQGITITIQ